MFLTAEAGAARGPAAETEAFRALEAPAPMAPDPLRALKQVNSHLVAAAAYPVLAEEGELPARRPRAAS
ncbi:MAG: hypothetical protein HIU82_04985 [Proteobacteria bacterium]|nr:hypothetical protein [Pseudomonadota bacterium]